MPTLVEEALKALPVVVGGLIAIGGGVAGQILTHRLTEAREKAKLRRERIESLVKAVYAHAQWVDEKHTKMVFQNEDHDAPSPLDEAQMIQALHFPELVDEMAEIRNRYIPLLQFITDQRLKHMQDKEKFIAEWNPAQFNEAYKNYLASVQKIVNKSRTLIAPREG